ncbi:helix-turn-helix domain-containing protein [Aeromonas piscicola]|nr:helix-turn-helix domain-containing protein [Aeromonas piscicola]
MIPAGQDWPRAYIRAVLAAKGISLRDLSRNQGLSEDTLRNALYRHWPKGEQLIANAIGEPPATIWPSRYQEQIPQVVGLNQVA